MAAALLSKMGYEQEERVQVKLEFLRLLTRLELDPARTELLTIFFETYLQLHDEEEEQLSREIRQTLPEEEVKIMERLTSWEKKGMEKGVQQGLEKGLEQGLEKGKTEARQEIAQRLLQMGMHIEDVMKATGLSKAEIESLRTNKNRKDT